MESFIIRIYRRGENSPEIAGLVEQVEINEQHPFTCFDELREILSLSTVKTRESGKLRHQMDRRKDGTDRER